MYLLSNHPSAHLALTADKIKTGNSAVSQSDVTYDLTHDLTHTLNFALHLTHPRCTHTAVNTHTHTHTHTHTVNTPPEQWAAIYGTFLPVQDSTSQLFDYESNSLTIRPQLLQSQCHGCRTDFVIEQTLSDRVFTRPDSCRATPRVVTV